MSSDEGVHSPDDDLSREGSEKRAKLRNEKRVKRERQKPAAVIEQQRDDDDVLGKVIEALNTKEKIRDAVAKANPRDLEKWTAMLMREVRNARKGSIGPLELMNMAEFNGLNRGGSFPYTPETYVVDVEKLMDRSIYEDQVVADLDVKSLHLKRERNVRVSEKWADYKFLKADEARKKGRIADFAEFKRLKKSNVNGAEAKATWKEYNQTWYLLMGLKPSVSSSERSFRQQVDREEYDFVGGAGYNNGDYDDDESSTDWSLLQPN